MRYAPGNHVGPNRDDKGKKGGACNVTSCQLPNSALWYNHSTQAYYCETCAKAINDSNRADAMRLYGHELCTLEEAEPQPHVNDGSKQAHAVSGFTASLGPIRVDVSAEATNARIVREAMDLVARELWDSDGSNKAALVVRSFRNIVHSADDATLAKLRRLLK